MNAKVKARKRNIQSKKAIKVVRALLFYVLLALLIAMAVKSQKQQFEPTTSSLDVQDVQLEAVRPYIAPREPVIGTASYYSTKDCLGCSRGLVMANGEVLEDVRLTVAYNRAPLNTVVKITNIKSGKSVPALVTDTGGFERYGRVADLSLKTKESLNCPDLCLVEIQSY